MMRSATYTTALGAGLGIIDETRALLDLWQIGIDAQSLSDRALQSGRFPNMSARRLRNLVVEGFGPRYLDGATGPAVYLKSLKQHLHPQEFNQLLFLYTCRTHLILADFVREVYWIAYSAGRSSLSNEEARAWVIRAVQDGKTTTPWSDNMIERVAGYLTRCCGDFGLLEGGVHRVRRILPYWVAGRTAAFLAYDLHYAGIADNALLAHPDWGLFGLERMDVLEELKKLMLKGLLIVQSAAGVTKISWQIPSMEKLIDVLAADELR